MSKRPFKRISEVYRKRSGNSCHLTVAKWEKETNGEEKDSEREITVCQCTIDRDHAHLMMLIYYYLLFMVHITEMKIVRDRRSEIGKLSRMNDKEREMIQVLIRLEEGRRIRKREKKRGRGGRGEEEYGQCRNVTMMNDWIKWEKGNILYHMEGKVWSGGRIEKVLSSVNRWRIGNGVREERE